MELVLVSMQCCWHFATFTVQIGFAYLFAHLLTQIIHWVPVCVKASNS